MTWLLEKTIPSATHCILIGNISKAILEIEKSNYSQILWILDKNESPIGVSHNIQILKFDAADINKDLKTAEQFLISTPAILPTLKVSQSISKLANAYEKLLAGLIPILDQRQRIRNSQVQQGYFVQKRIFENLPWVLEHPLPQTLKNRFTNHCALVIGAGPSLDITLPLVEQWEFKPIIIVADSAVSAVEKTKLPIHFVVGIDPKKTCTNCSISTRRGIGVFTSDIDKSFLSTWGTENCYCIPKGEMTEKWLQKHGWETGEVKAENNAGLTGILLADFLGVNAIVLIGMDMACNNTRYASLVNRKLTLTDASVQIPGNYKETVATPFPSDWQITASATKLLSSQKSIVNFNDRGARLEGTTLVHPRDSKTLEKTLQEHLQSLGNREVEVNFITEPNAKICEYLKKFLREGEMFLSKLQTLSEKEKLDALKEWTIETDHAQLVGSHAYNLMSFLVQNRNDQNFVSKWLSEYESLLTTLKKFF